MCCSWAKSKNVVVAVIVLAFSGFASSQAKETVIYNFQGGSDGATPGGNLVMDKAGNLYGTALNSSPCDGLFQCGTVFELSPPSQPGQPWTEITLHLFQGYDYRDGGSPGNGVIQDVEGNLYGTTGYGGNGPCLLLGGLVGCGTVYELIRPKSGETWTEKILYRFQGGQDGQLPLGPLVFDKFGNLYGATEFGGGLGDTCDPYYPYCGTVFELSPTSTNGDGPWRETILHSFAGVETGDGANPNGGMVFDEKGVLYGTTAIGGYDCPHNSGAGCGTLFKLSPLNDRSTGWTETVIYQFTNHVDGRLPNGDLISDRVGNLYGTTLSGGRSRFPSGTVFRFALQPDGTYTRDTLFNFDDGADGGSPLDGLVFDHAGNLYGTAGYGGNPNYGTVFRIVRKSGAFQQIYSFQMEDGHTPDGRLLFDATENAYGTTAYGGDGTACGNSGCGTVYMITR